MTYPTTSGFVAHSDTSRASAEKLDASGNAESYDNIIAEFLHERREHGATADEIRLFMLPQYPHLHNGTVNGRLCGMWRDGKLVKSSLKRVTSANRMAHVYIHTSFSDGVPCEPPYWEVVGGDLNAAQSALRYILSTYNHNDSGYVTSHLTATDLKDVADLCRRAGVSSKLFEVQV